MINLSDFNKNVKVNLTTGEKEARFNGEFEFYTLNKERFEIIKKGIDNLNNNANDLEVSYTLLPYICSINVDEPLDKFYEMNEYSPCMEFTEFMISLTEYIQNLMKQIDKMKEMQTKVDGLMKEYPMLKKQETIEEKIMRLTDEMQKEKDSKKKKVIFLQLAKLYSEVENND